MAVEARTLGGARATAAAFIAEPLNAPLFSALLRRFSAGGRWVVLDLGAARSHTLRTFSRFRCRLDVIELADGLDALNGEADPRRVRQRAEALLLPRREEAYNVVLCWDLINYLNQPALTALMECIALRCQRGALAHGLVYYSAMRMPERPSTFVPFDDQRLAQLSMALGERPAPRYSPEDLVRCMPRYHVERGRLLRNGMQEFLFRL